MAMAAVEEEDPAQVRAAQILVSLRFRPIRRWPEWVPMQHQPSEASSSPPVTSVAAAAAKVMPPSGEASSSAGTVAARVVPVRRPPERVISMQSGEASFSLAGTVAAGLPAWGPKNKRSGLRGETSREPEQGHAAAAAKVSGAPRSSEQERCADMPAAASAQAQQPVAAAVFCYSAVAVAGPGPSTTSAPAPANKEPMKTPSPNSPLDYGSGAPSSADDAAPATARPQAKRKGTAGGDDEGCSSSPAKRAPVAQEEEKKPMPISAEPSVQNETRASSSGKGAPRPFDLNLCPLDEEDDGCPETD